MHDGGAGDAAQGDDEGGGGGGGGGGGAGGDGRGVGPPAFAAGAVGIITAQRAVKARKLQWALFASFATYMALRTGLPAPPLIVFSSSTRPSATFLDSRPDAEFPHQRSSVAVCDQGQW